MTEPKGDSAPMPGRYGRIVDYVRATPWAITPAMADVIGEILALRASGHRLTREEIAARIGAAEAPPRPPKAVTRSGVAVLGLRGVIAHRAEFFEQTSSSGTSIERFRARFRDALKDTNIGAVVIDVDSPGGAVDGVAELAAEIRAARGGGKPIVAVANTLAASAAYFIASAADEISITPSGLAGSIGVFSIHEDLSRQLEMLGVKVTLISAGAGKTEGNPFEPLDEEAEAAIQDRVDAFFDLFVDAVAKGRGVKPAKVRGGFGTGKPGRLFSARQAVEIGLADQVETLDEALSRLSARPGRRPARGVARTFGGAARTFDRRMMDAAAAGRRGPRGRHVKPGTGS